MPNASAYPLQWPVAYSRTKQADKKHGAFRLAFAKSRDLALKELDKMKAKQAVISSNVPLKKDGVPFAVPYGSGNITDDTGIALYFLFDGEQKVICCDAFHTLDDNMAAIAHSIQAMRSLVRWKCSDLLSRAFAGTTTNQLPAAKHNTWLQVLHVSIHSTWEEIEASYRQLRKKMHPDVEGGSVAAFQELQEAFAYAKLVYHIA